MRVFVETNFVLELVYRQEQHVSCEEILNFADKRKVQLFLPAYCFVECHENLTRNRRDRDALRRLMDLHIAGLERTAENPAIGKALRTTRRELASIADEHRDRLRSLHRRLLHFAQVIPLTGAVLREAARLESECLLVPQDAVALASILNSLQTDPSKDSCFLSRDRRDFLADVVVAELARHRCKILPLFDQGLGFIRAHL